MVKKIDKFADFLISKYGNDLSEVVVVVEDYRSIPILQNAFGSNNFPVFLPSFYAFNNIPCDDLSYFKLPNLLSFNAAVISFSEYLFEFSDVKNWNQALSLSKYVISYLCMLSDSNIDFKKANDYILSSNYSDSLYRELPLDLLISWKNSIDCIMPFESSKYFFEVIKHKIIDLKKNFYFFDIGSENLKKIESLKQNNKNLNSKIFFINNDFEKNLKRNVFDYYEFSSFYDQISHIVDVSDSYINNRKKVGIVGLDSKLNKIFYLELAKRLINIQQKVSLLDLSENFFLSDEDSIANEYINPSKSCKLLDKFWYKVAKDFQNTSFSDKRNISNVPEDVINYVLSNNFAKLGENNQYVTCFKGIEDLCCNDCDVLIFVCQNNFPGCNKDELKILDQDKIFLQMEKKFHKYASCSEVILTYSSSKGIHPYLLSKLQISGMVNDLSKKFKTNAINSSDSKLLKNKNASFKLLYLPKVISLTAINNLINSPYKFFINNFLNLKPVDNKGEISQSKISDIFHKSIKELLSSHFDNSDNWDQNLFDLVEENFQLFDKVFFENSKYRKLYSPFVKMLCKRLIKFLKLKFLGKKKILLENDFLYNHKSGVSVKFRCDGIIFDDKINVIEYKLSNSSVNSFKFQIIMETYMLFELLKFGNLNDFLNKNGNFKEEDIFATYVKIAMGDRFKTQDFYLFNDGIINKETEKILDLFFDFLGKDEHIIEQIDDNYKHFSRILE